MVRARAKITGRVQGVSFRATAADQARSRGLAGWVRNEPDGSVLLEAQGEEEEVKALLEWCRQGPPGARVLHAEVAWIEPRTDENSFRIRG
jgi:acylphosphatase